MMYAMLHFFTLHFKYTFGLYLQRMCLRTWKVAYCESKFAEGLPLIAHLFLFGSRAILVFDLVTGGLTRVLGCFVRGFASTTICVRAIGSLILILIFKSHVTGFCAM